MLPEVTNWDKFYPDRAQTHPSLDFYPDAGPRWAQGVGSNPGDFYPDRHKALGQILQIFVRTPLRGAKGYSGVLATVAISTGRIWKDASHDTKIFCVFQSNCAAKVPV